MSAIECLVDDLESVVDKLGSEDPIGLTDGGLTRLLGHLNRVEAKLRSVHVAMVAEVESRELHRSGGFRSVGGFVAHHLRVHPGQAAGTAALAHKRRLLPETMAALAAGEISEARAQIIGRAHTRRVAEVFQRDESLLVDKARSLPFKQFQWFVQHWVDIADPDRGKESAERAVRERRLHCSQVGDKFHTDAVSDVISGTALKAAIERVEKELFAQDWAWTQAEYGDAATPAMMPRNPAQRRHDALILLVERGSAAPADAKRPEPLVNVICDWDTFQKAVGALAGGAAPHYDLDGTCELLDGTPITPGQAIEQALLGHVARVVFGAANVVLNAGRSRRFFTKRMKAILGVRDRHCTWPGCDMPPARCEADHIQEWDRGGPTAVANGRLACRYHHRMYRMPAGGRRPSG